MRTPRPSYHRNLPPHDPIVRRIFEEIDNQQVAMQDLADRAGVNRVTISAWKRRNNPSLANIQAVANVLGLEIVIRWKKDFAGRESDSA